MESVPPYFEFYRSTLADLLRRQVVTRSMRVLVVCGGETDREVFRQLDFNDVTISNLDESWTAADIAPFRWEIQNAENLTYADNTFDLVVVCAGLHHCHSPHRALLEMVRVARHCVLVLEARDSWFSRIAVVLKMADAYELSAVVGEDYHAGGVGNSPVPNFVYRWSEREVYKTLAAYIPQTEPNIRWYHAFAPPLAVLKGRRNSLALMMMVLAYPAVWLVTQVFRKQGNLLAFAIIKPNRDTELLPWLQWQGRDVVLNRQWLDRRFVSPEGASEPEAG